MKLYLSDENGYSPCGPRALSKIANPDQYKHILVYALDEGSNAYHSKLIKKYRDKAIFWMIEKDDTLFYLISIKIADFSEVEKITKEHGLSNRSEIKKLVYKQDEKEFRVIRPFAKNTNVHFYISK